MKAWGDWDEFLRRLREDAVFREEVRRQVLTEDLLALPAVVEANFAKAFDLIAENSRQIASLTEQVRGLTERMDRVEGQIATLTEQVQENSRQIASLTEQVRENSRQIAENSRQIASLTEQVRGLTEKMRDMDRTLSRHGQVVGAAWEDRARDFFFGWLPTRGVRLLGPFWRVAREDWEIDGVAEAEDSKGRVWLLLEAKGRVDEADIRRFARRLEDANVRLALGIRGRVQPWVWGGVLSRSAEAAAREVGVGLIEPRFGALVEPVEQEWG